MFRQGGVFCYLPSDKSFNLNGRLGIYRSSLDNASSVMVRPVGGLVVLVGDMRRERVFDTRVSQMLPNAYSAYSSGCRG